MDHYSISHAQQPRVLLGQRIMISSYTAMYITPPPWADFPWSITPQLSWNSAGAKRVGVGNVSPRAFRRRFVRCWHPLGCRAIELGKPRKGGVVYTEFFGRPDYFRCALVCTRGIPRAKTLILEACPWKLSFTHRTDDLYDLFSVDI